MALVVGTEQSAIVDEFAKEVDVRSLPVVTDEFYNFLEALKPTTRDALEAAAVFCGAVTGDAEYKNLSIDGRQESFSEAKERIYAMTFANLMLTYWQMINGRQHVGIKMGCQTADADENRWGHFSIKWIPSNEEEAAMSVPNPDVDDAATVKKFYLDHVPVEAMAQRMIRMYNILAATYIGHTEPNKAKPFFDTFHEVVNQTLNQTAEDRKINNSIAILSIPAEDVRAFARAEIVWRRAVGEAVPKRKRLNWMDKEAITAFASVCVDEMYGDMAINRRVLRSVTKTNFDIIGIRDPKTMEHAFNIRLPNQKLIRQRSQRAARRAAHPTNNPQWNPA